MNIPEKWATVYEMCKEFLAHPGEPSTKPIDWCVSLIEENATLREALQWRLITETDLPKVGDEVLGLADKVRRVDACDTLKTFKWWEKETFWTHFRPIAPPTEGDDNGA